MTFNVSFSCTSGLSGRFALTSRYHGPPGATTRTA